MMEEIRRLARCQTPSNTSWWVDSPKIGTGRKDGSGSPPLDLISTTPRRNSKRRIVYGVALPSWAFRKGIQVMLDRSSNSWGLTVRIYNRLGPGARIFNAACDHDWNQVWEMFATGQASPYDVDEYNRTLFHMAAVQIDPDACRRLADYGLDPGRESALLCLSSVDELLLRRDAEECSAFEQARVIQAFRFLAQASPESFILEDGSIKKLLLSFSPEIVSAVIESVSTSYGPVDLTQRVLAAFHHSVHIDTMDLLLGADLSMQQAFAMACDNQSCYHAHIDLLCNIARELGQQDVEEHRKERCLRILEDIVEFEAQNTLFHHYRSPLDNFLTSYIEDQPPALTGPTSVSWNEYFTKAARSWLSMLVQAGANLENYGMAEEYLIHYERYYSTSTFRQFRVQTGRSRRMVFYIQSIVYGPNVDDWKVFVAPTKLWTWKSMHSSPGYLPPCFVEDAEYETAGEFWNWVENPELFNIPGAFIDADDDAKSPPYAFGGTTVWVQGSVL